MEKRLRLGAAYHGNRMLRHAREDLLDMATHGMDLVVHMFSHTDWDRHKMVMKDMIAMSEDMGLDVWVDNWGLAGPPGDKSHFLSYYPDSHIYYSNGDMDPVRVCLNSPDFRRFTKEWIDTVYHIGGRTIFWDEPQLPQKTIDGKTYYGCACPRCKKKFEELYGRPMPEVADAEAERFGTDSIIDYFREITAYSAAKGMKNVVCVMLGSYGMNLSVVDRICSLPYVDNIGSDPYWVYDKRDNPDLNVYGFVYEGAKKNIQIADRFQKDHNVWIQTFDNPRGQEEDIVVAAEAAYDAGARTIIAWGYYGSESNDYRAANPAVTWAKTCEAMQRVRNFERDRILAENRKKYMK